METEASHGVGVVSSNMVVALFLVSNGADMHIKDLRGNTPLSLCPKDSTALVKEYSEKGYIIIA
jgi:ankyrin repeat protein